MAIANGTNSYMPPKNLLIFEKDLAFIPSFYANEDDAIIMEELPDESFLDQWYNLGLPKLHFIKPSDVKPPINYDFLCPWSWNQTVHLRYKNILPFGSDEFKSSPNYVWNNERRLLFSRNTANRVQTVINQSIKNNKVCIPTPAINIDSIDQFLSWIKEQDKVIIKLPWSSSGRGIHMIDKEINKQLNLDWVKGSIRQQGFVTAEPLLNKVFDFSFQLNIKRDGNIDLQGYSFSLNDDKGHFIGGNINWPHEKDELSQFLTQETLEESANILINALKSINPHHFYEGPIGVDAIVYLNEQKEYKIHPCLEINWRYNMGLVNINLKRFVDQSSKGNWFIGSFQQEEWNNFIVKNQQEKPLVMKKNKIVSGFINLTPANKNARFGAWMEIF